MFTMNVPRIFWFEAIQTAVYLMNMMPFRVLSFRSPHEVLPPTTPLFPCSLKTFSCICYLHVPKSNRSKLDHKALKCVFLGYRVDKKGYKYYHPLTHCKFVSRDATFFEFIPFFSSCKTSLQGEQFVTEELSPLVLLLVPVPIYHFDDKGDGGKGGKELQV